MGSLDAASWLVRTPLLRLGVDCCRCHWLAGSDRRTNRQTDRQRDFFDRRADCLAAAAAALIAIDSKSMALERSIAMVIARSLARRKPVRVD